MGVLGTITQACYIKGMSEGDAAVMAPIDYTRLVFAVILGYALFRDVPDAMTMLGAGIVIASTIYITLREARLGKPEPTAGARRMMWRFVTFSSHRSTSRSSRISPTTGFTCPGGFIRPRISSSSQRKAWILFHAHPDLAQMGFPGCEEAMGPSAWP